MDRTKINFIRLFALFRYGLWGFVIAKWLTDDNDQNHLMLR